MPNNEQRGFLSRLLRRNPEDGLEQSEIVYEDLNIQDDPFLYSSSPYREYSHLKTENPVKTVNPENEAGFEVTPLHRSIFLNHDPNGNLDYSQVRILKKLSRENLLEPLLVLLDREDARGLISFLFTPRSWRSILEDYLNQETIDAMSSFLNRYEMPAGDISQSQDPMYTALAILKDNNVNLVIKFMSLSLKDFPDGSIMAEDRAERWQFLMDFLTSYYWDDETIEKLVMSPHSAKLYYLLRYGFVLKKNALHEVIRDIVAQEMIEIFTDSLTEEVVSLINQIAQAFGNLEEVYNILQSLIYEIKPLTGFFVLLVDDPHFEEKKELILTMARRIRGVSFFNQLIDLNDWDIQDWRFLKIMMDLLNEYVRHDFFRVFDAADRIRSEPNILDYLDEKTIELVNEIWGGVSLEIFSSTEAVKALSRIAHSDQFIKDCFGLVMISIRHGYRKKQLGELIVEFGYANIKQFELFDYIRRDLDVGLFFSFELFLSIIPDDMTDEFFEIIKHEKFQETLSSLNLRLENILADMSATPLFLFLKYLIDRPEGLMIDEFSEPMTILEISDLVDGSVDRLIIVMELFFNGKFNLFSMDIETKDDREMLIGDLWRKTGHILRQILEHENASDFFQVMRLDELVSLMSGDGVESNISFLLYYPDFAKLALELRESGKSPSEMNWSEKINILIRALTALGLRGAEDQVNRKMITMWGTNKDVYISTVKLYVADVNHPARQYAEQWASSEDNMSLDGGKVYSWQELVSLLPDSAITQIASWFRQKMAQAEYHQMELDERKDIASDDHLIEKIVREIGDLESRPSTSFLTTVGWEIEHNFSAVLEKITKLGGLDSPKDFFRFLGRHGFKIGMESPIESSPGPFDRPEIAARVYSEFRDGELIPGHDNLQTLHFNVGLHSFHLAARLTRIMQSTAYAFLPTPGLYGYENRFENSTGLHSNYVTQNQQQGISYIEIKSHYAFDRSGVERQLLDGGKLAAAAKAYEIIYIMIHDGEGRGGKNYLLNGDINPQLTRDEIENAHVDGILKKLALIWLETEEVYKLAMEQIGLGEMCQHYVPVEQKRKHDEMMMQVFPHYDDIDPNTKKQRLRLYGNMDDYKIEKQIEGGEITIDGRRYPNYIAFARSLVFDAVDQIDYLLDQVDAEFIDLLESAYTEPDPDKQQELFEQMQREFSRIVGPVAQEVDRQMSRGVIRKDSNRIRHDGFYDEDDDDREDEIEQHLSERPTNLRRENILFRLKNRFLGN